MENCKKEKHMIEYIENYYDTLFSLINLISATEKGGGSLEFYQAIVKTVELVVSQSDLGKKTIFIGNGASASISSHIATDLWKNGGIKAITFNDSSLLTCISNDYGYEYVFEKPLSMFAETGDILFAISSSGKSKNIIKAVEKAQNKGCYIITLSGFNKVNPLRSLGDINFYVPCSSYGPVEILHHSICHCMINSIVNKKSNCKAVKNKVY